MIELTKYSKRLPAYNQPTKVLTHEESFRSKLVTTFFSLLLFTIVIVSLSICYTSVDPNEFNLNLYEREANTPEMQAYLNFVATYGRNYGDANVTAYRYRVFK